MKNGYPASHYEEYIQANFTIDHCGIDLETLGKKDFELTFPVTLDSFDLLDPTVLKNEINEITGFIDNVYSTVYEKPLWYKINVIDQAVNEYVGIGFLNRNGNWLNFILHYLNNDRAEQSGDTIFTLFDLELTWAVSFTLSQDDSLLRIERFRK